MWSWVKKKTERWRGLSEADFEQKRQAILQHAPVPVIWLFGKTGSGKTSLIRFLTGADDAEIGNGFRPQTKASRRFVFPSVEEPLVEFLDTRGLGEVHYDPADDIRAFRDTTHVMIVTARAIDQALDDIVRPLREIRRAKPECPVLLALTCLHELYPQQQHPQPDPFASEPIPESLPLDAQRAIRQQHDRFAGLVDRIVPIDFTKPIDGFAEPDFGGERLEATLVDLLPRAYRQTLLQLHDALLSLRDLNERRAMPYILSYSTMAATAASFPIPWVDMPVVVGIQTHLVYKLASLYGQKFDRNSVLSVIGPLGGRMALRQVMRESLKAIPWLGMAANAAVAYAYTFALGKASCWYFGQVRQGNAPSAEELKQVWKQQLGRTAEIWKGR